MSGLLSLRRRATMRIRAPASAPPAARDTESPTTGGCQDSMVTPRVIVNRAIKKRNQRAATRAPSSGTRASQKPRATRTIGISNAGPDAPRKAAPSSDIAISLCRTSHCLAGESGADRVKRAARLTITTLLGVPNPRRQARIYPPKADRRRATAPFGAL